MQKARVITKSQPSIDEIVCNVNKPWHEHKGCCCHCDVHEGALRALTLPASPRSLRLPERRGLAALSSTQIRASQLH